MAAKSKRIDPIKQREKRAKIGAIVGFVLFLAVAAYEVPSMMKMLNQKPPPGANPTSTTAAPASTAGLPNVAGGAAPTGAASTSSSGLVDTDLTPSTPSANQLVSFSAFPAKNPFRPQVPAGTSGGSASAASGSTTPAGGTSGSAAAAAPSTPAAAPVRVSVTRPATKPASAAAPRVVVPSTSTSTPTPTSSAGSASASAPVTPPASTTPATTTPAPAPTVAISVNGVVSHVAAEDTFPSGSPVFRLVSWTKRSAGIGIVGGSYASGGAVLTIQVGKPVTLENTSDGRQYKLVLLST